MANDAFTQQALARDESFKQRIRAALAKVAWQVLNESINIDKHVERAAFARSVINDVEVAANRVAPWIVMRTNVYAFTTSYDFQNGAVVTASGDADIESQINTDWNNMAGL